MLWSPLGSILEMHFYQIFHKRSCPECKSSKMLQHALLPCLRNTLILPLFCNHFIGYKSEIALSSKSYFSFSSVSRVLLLTINLVHEYTPVRSLRSSNSGSLVIPKSTKPWGERACAHTGPTLCNNLVIKNSMPPDFFKINLKTHLFNASFWLSYSSPVFVLSIVPISIFPMHLEHSTEWKWCFINHMN